MPEIHPRSIKKLVEHYQKEEDLEMAAVREDTVVSCCPQENFMHADEPEKWGTPVKQENLFYIVFS